MQRLEFVKVCLYAVALSAGGCDSSSGGASDSDAGQSSGSARNDAGDTPQSEGGSSSVDFPEGLPTFCQAYAECCYQTLSKELCDSLLDGIIQSKDFLSEAMQRDLCSGCRLPNACSDADALTVESLQKAKQALVDGDDNAKLTPYGCLQYSRTLVDGAVTGETLRFGNDGTLLSATYAEHEAMLIVQVAGETTFQASAETDAQGELSNLTLEELDTGPEPRHREVYTPTASEDTLQVSAQVRAKDGTPTDLGEFTTSISQAAFGPQPGGFKTEGCDASQANELEQLLQSAVVEGFRCMDERKRNDIGMFVLGQYLTRTITFNCAAKGTDPLIAQISEIGRFTSWLFGSFTININTDRFFAKDAQGNRTLSENVRKNVLFHELLHLFFGAHQPSLGGKRQTEYDRTYACAGTCFELDGEDNKTTKCACATCLNTDVCDSRCSGFKDCDPDMGASCNALPVKWYASALECDSSCTAACEVHDVSCDPCN